MILKDCGIDNFTPWYLLLLFALCLAAGVGLFVEAGLLFRTVRQRPRGPWFFAALLLAVGVVCVLVAIYDFPAFQSVRHLYEEPAPPNPYHLPASPFAECWASAYAEFYSKSVLVVAGGVLVAGFLALRGFPRARSQR